MRDRKKHEDRDTTNGEKSRLQDPGRAAPAPPDPAPYPDPVDDTLDDSFPASDPPPWWGR